MAQQSHQIGIISSESMLRIMKHPWSIFHKSPSGLLSAYADRYSNLEVLRIVCMLLIVAGHLIMWHKFDSEYIERIVRCGIRPFFSVAVNCFVLISGWFGIQFKSKKIISLNSTLTFWTFVPCAIALLYGIHVIDIRRDLLMLVPLLTRQYWFITIYVALCFLAPYLNILVRALSKKDFKRLLIVCICLFVVIPTVAAFLNFASITTDGGYGIVNFTVLYLFGRYMRIHEEPKRSALLYFAIYAVLMTFCGAIQLIYSKILGFEFTTLISYDTFFVFFGAIALFCSFSRLNFKNNFINLLASVSFSVYVIHIHPWTDSWIFENVLGLRKLEDGWFILALFIVPVIVYIGCFILEQMRVIIFKTIGRDLCYSKK